MAYRKYITEALVCGSAARNSADISYRLLTKESGMLYARARSVRHERSRNRYALQDFSLITVSLVHGKSGWQVTSAEALGNVYSPLQTRLARAYVRNLVRLLRRYIHGEEVVPGLYEEVLTAVELLAEVEDSVRLGELASLRLLHHLGYVDSADALEDLIEPDIKTAWENYDASKSQAVKRALTEAEQASHL